MSTTATTPNRPTLRALLDTVGTGCTECGRCVTECVFLRRYGTPKVIADSFDASDKALLSRSFECSLCGLCGGLRSGWIGKPFLEMRAAVERGFGHFPACHC
jgi:ferredoxin